MLNRGQPFVTFAGTSGSNRMMAERHHAWAAHVALQPLSFERTLRSNRWARGLEPALSLGGTWERIKLEYQGYDPSTMTFGPASSRIASHGYEVTVLNVFSYRRGHVSDPDGSIDGAASGWSLGYTFAHAVGFRYDRARIPQASDPSTGVALSDVHRRAWSVFVDPLALRWHPPAR
jgi:hypothetical protein